MNIMNTAFTGILIIAFIFDGVYLTYYLGRHGFFRTFVDQSNQDRMLLLVLSLLPVPLMLFLQEKLGFHATLIHVATFWILLLTAYIYGCYRRNYSKLAMLGILLIVIFSILVVSLGDSHIYVVKNPKIFLNALKIKVNGD